ncbi:MAG TPA: hypothetical protein VFU69_08110 [Ktedonobacterales bacterium]|nr:hypothetical protein [Ktedonobacterales bacterium]
MSSALRSAPVSLPPALSSPVPVRARAPKRRKPARPAPPQKPLDFFSQQAHALLTELFIKRAERWQADRLPPMYFYPRDSMPLWGDYAKHRCSGTTLRVARQGLLYESLSVDLERGLRLLTLAWTPQGTTTDGHDLEEWRLSLAGVLWRIGQLFRELTRRKVEERAREVVRLAMETLWQ